MRAQAFVTDFAVPAVVFFLMLVVGTGLTLDDLRRVGRHPRVVVGATLAQVIGLPLLGGMLVWAFDPRPALAGGLILLTACPGGALSNLYTFLARAHVALSVTLTAVSSIASVVTLPVVTSAGFRWFLAEDAQVTVPVLGIVGQLVALLLLPIGLGMAGAARWPTWVDARRRVLERLGLGGVVAVLAFVVATERSVFVDTFAASASLALVFTALAMTAGWWAGRWLSPTRADHFTVMVELGTRNLGIAVLVAVTVLGRPDFLVLGAVIFIVESALALFSVAIYRSRTTRIATSGR